MAAGGLFLRVRMALERVFLRRELMGLDTTGNKYYRAFEKDINGYYVEKRWVQMPGAHYEYSPEAIPPEWFRWLNKGRIEPPTLEELSASAQRREMLKERVAQLEAQEQQRKLRAQTVGESGMSQEQPPMEQFVRQLVGKGLGMDYGGQDQAAQNTTASESSKEFKPESWAPGGTNTNK